MGRKKCRVNTITVPQLRGKLKLLGLKVSGRKAALVARLHEYEQLVRVAKHSQRLARGWLARRYIARKGPALHQRDLSVNSKDFYTQEPVARIPHQQFFSFTDTAGQRYSFNLLSFSNLRIGPDTQLRNPYTRLVIADDVSRAAKAAIRLGRILGYDVETSVETSVSKGEEIMISLFQEINTLGNHTNYRWLSDAPTRRLRLFCINLHVIWKHRTGMTDEVRRRVCPPHGEPLSACLLSPIPTYSASVDREAALISIGKACLYFITAAQDIEDRRLAVNLLLCSLTTISRRAATALPWLYQSVADPQSS